MFHPAVGSTHTAHVEGHEDDGAVLADETLVQRVRLDLAAQKPFKLCRVRRQVIGVGHFGPGLAQQFFARVAEDFAQTVVAAQPALGFGRADGNADEREVVELPEHLVRARLHFQLHGPFALAPEQEDHGADHDQCEQRNQAHPEGQLAERHHHFAAVEFGDDHPFRPGHRAIGRQHVDAAIVPAFADARTRLVDRRNDRIVRQHRRLPQGQSTALETARFVDEQHLFAIAPDEQGFSAGAGGRPVLDKGEHELLGPDAEDQPPDRLALTVAGERHERDDEIEAQGAIRIGNHFAMPGLMRFQCWLQQRRRARQLSAELADLEQGLTQRIDEQGRFVLHRIDGGNQMRADGLAHGAIGILFLLQGRNLSQQIGRSHDHGTVVLALVQPVLDLTGLEVGDRLQVGKGFALDLRLVNLEHDESGQRDEQGEDDEQQRPRPGAHAPDGRTAPGDGGSLGHRRAPFAKHDIQEAAGNGDEEQPLGYFDPPLQDRVVDTHVQQGAGNGDPERGEDGIKQRHADGRQSPFFALRIALRVNWLRHQVLVPVYDMLFCF